MQMPIFRIHEVNDETCEFYLNGDIILTATHDNHGWDGMQVAQELFENIAEKLGAEIEFTSADLDDYEDDQG